MVGDTDRARTLVPRASGADAPAFENTVIDAWAGDEVAFQRVLAICDEDPLNVPALGWAARLEGRRGHVDEQNRYLRWAFTIGGSNGTEIRVSDHPMIGRTAQGDVGEFWGHLHVSTLNALESARAVARATHPRIGHRYHCADAPPSRRLALR